MIELLQQLVADKILRPLDIQFARTLVKNDDPLLLLLLTLVSVEVGTGHVCLPISRITPEELLSGRQHPLINLLWQCAGSPTKETIFNTLFSSDAVSDGSLATPIVLSNDKLYLHRMWRAECEVAEFFSKTQENIIEISQLKSILDLLFGQSVTVDWQKVAAAVALTSKTAIISGGPGTGKTTTVAKILAAIVKLTTDELIIQLAAPTGKAAARLTESLGNAIRSLSLTEKQLEMIPNQAQTLHRLLGAQPESQQLRYHHKNPLVLDILIIDEASMVDLPMMAALIDALPAHAKLILLGDKDQLASVEAGAVLGDICRFADKGFSEKRSKQLAELTGCDISQLLHPNNTSTETVLINTEIPVQDHLCLLRKSFRFNENSGIGKLASAVNCGDTKKTLQVLSQSLEDVHYIPLNNDDDYQRILTDAAESYLPYLKLVKQRACATEILAAFNQYRLLCALREGPFGVAGLNTRIEQLLHRKGAIRKPTMPSSRGQSSRGYVGKPIMISRNDSSLGLFNGDIGIMLMNDEGELRAYFQLPDGKIKSIQPSRLPAHEIAYVMTVHKSQGSEFEHTALVLPLQVSPLVSRELFYTALTRARNNLTLYANEKSIKWAVKTPTQRRSGLNERLVTPVLYDNT